MSIFDVLWKLPASVALQIYYCRLTREGMVLVTGESDRQLLKRLRECQT